MAQRQFRIDDTSPWAHRFGYAGLGNVTISTSQTISHTRASGSCASGATAFTCTPTGFSIGDLVVIWQKDGNWEFNQVTGVTGDISLAYATLRAYNDNAQIIQVRQYNNFTVNTGVNLSFSGWNGTHGGLAVIFCNGTFTLNGHIQGYGGQGANQNSGSPAGGDSGIGGLRGGHGDDVNSDCASAGASGEFSTTYGSGTASSYNSSNCSGSDGAGGSNGSAGDNGHMGVTLGTHGNVVGNDSLTLLSLGGGGAGGGWETGRDNVGGGGQGGAALLIVARKVSGSGVFDFYGADSAGTNNSSGSPRPGGAGAGGSLLWKLQDANGVSSFTYNMYGGRDNAAQNNGYGGYGGGGRINLDYGFNSAGTTPTITSASDATHHAAVTNVRQDGSLIDTGGSFFFGLM